MTLIRMRRRSPSRVTAVGGRPPRPSSCSRRNPVGSSSVPATGRASRISWTRSQRIDTSRSPARGPAPPSASFDVGPPHGARATRSLMIRGATPARVGGVLSGRTPCGPRTRSTRAADAHGGPHEAGHDRAGRRGRQAHRAAVSQAVPAAGRQAAAHPCAGEGARHPRHRSRRDHLPGGASRGDAAARREPRVRCQVRVHPGWRLAPGIGLPRAWPSWPTATR